MKVRIRVALIEDGRGTHGVFQVDLTPSDVEHAKRVDSVDGRAIWRLTQRLVEAGRMIDMSATPVFEIL